MVDALADEFAIHPRTLRAGARDGRLRIQLSTRSAFGRPVRLASRAAVDEFVRLHYRQRYSRFARPLPRPQVIVVPSNFDAQLVRLRQRLRLTQAQLAYRIGAANKSVIYQWEARKRTPCVVFWSRVEQLRACHPGANTEPLDDAEGDHLTGPLASMSTALASDDRL